MRMRMIKNCSKWDRWVEEGKGTRETVTYGLEDSWKYPLPDTGNRNDFKRSRGDAPNGKE